MNGLDHGQGHQAAVLRPVRWRRAAVATSVLMALVGTIVGFAPTVITRTALRHQVLSTALAQYGLAAVTAEASGGWVKPISFSGIEFSDPQGRFTCRIKEIRTSKGLLGYFAGDQDLGLITLVEPDIECHIDENGKWPAGGTMLPGQTTCEFVIERGKFRLVVPWRELPIVDLESLDLRGRVAREESGERKLTVDAFRLFDNVPLSDSHTSQNLALIAPVLSQSTRLTGAASVWLEEIRMSLDGTLGPVSPFPIRGRAEFHSLEAHLKQDWAVQIAQLAGQLTQTDLPDRVTVVKDSAVSFSVDSDGISHHGMVFLLPEISPEIRAESSGTIRLDESLDLTLALQLPRLAAPQNPALAVLGQLIAEPIQLKVGGTISKPRIETPAGSAILNELSARIAPDQHTDQVPPVSQAVFELIQETGQTDKAKARRELPGGILRLIRSLQAEKERKSSGGKK